MIIGITGTDGAGKGTVVEYLVKNKGFKLYHARALFLEEIKKRHLPTDRVHMRLVANDLRKQFGNDYIVSLFLDRAKAENVDKVVIDSLRTVAEAETLQGNDGILLAIDADQTLRYERIHARNSESDQVTFEEFAEHEELESNDPDPHGMQKQKVMSMADYTIYNDNNTEALYKEVEKFLEKYTSN
ncbi:MAG: AAA family ATPase [Candidatus Paceibacterota bacterium]